MRLHRKTVALDRATVVRLLFHLRLFRQQFTIQISIFRSHDYLVASDRAPIVKGPFYDIYFNCVLRLFALHESLSIYNPFKNLY